MSREINDILASFKEAQRHGRQTALATVVHVEGSSYRRPGARMLVEDNGKITGAISGGCLEGDALRKALLAINQRQNKLVTYNTLQQDEVEFGVQLGCNGIVHILFEPIDSNNEHNPIALLEKFQSEKKNAVVVTLFSLKNFHGQQAGTCVFFSETDFYSAIEDKHLETEIKKDASQVLVNKSSLLKQYANGELNAFVELLEPPVSLIIVGAGNDALPLVDMATVLGWQITVADGRSTHANRQRFAKANSLIVAKPAEAAEQFVIDDRTVIVLMTHNYNYDLALMRLLFQKKCTYLGILGPKKRLDRLLTELEDEGIVIPDENRDMIFGPIGLDIGAETPEEIALSILAEIKTVIAGRHGSFLRERADEIHTRSAPVVDEIKANPW
jgi:xanthine dehydrogenase accessory factor